MSKWMTHVEKWNDWAGNSGQGDVEFHYVGESDLLKLLTLEEHAGRVFYWFTAVQLSDAWFRQRLLDAKTHAGPRYTPNLNVELPLAFAFEGLGRTQSFEHRLREHLGKMRQSRSNRWMLRKLEEDPELKLALQLADEALDELDARTLALNIVGGDAVPLDDLVNDCDWVVDRLSAVSELLERCRHAVRERSRDQETYGAGQTPTQELASNYASASAWVYRTRSCVVELRSFAQSDAAHLINLPALLLTGGPGAGKTHLLMDVAEKRLADGGPALVLFGQHLGEVEPWHLILDHLHLDCSPDVFLGALEAAAEAAGSRALLCIDALNESAPGIWHDHLAAFVNRVRRFPRIGLVLSCRTSYVPVVVPGELLQGEVVEIEHTGFGERTPDAVHRFFDHFGLVRPDFPLVVPEFANPLFLKLMCQALHGRSETRFPRGASAVTTLFSWFLEAAERALAKPQRLDYPTARGLVQKSVDALARELLVRDDEWIPFERADELTGAYLPGRDWSRSLLKGLQDEGVLIRDIVRTGVEVPAQEVVRFAYQRLSDHVQATAICDDERGIDGVQARIELWAADDGILWSKRNLLEALAIHLPERFGRELHEVVQRPNTHPIQQAFLTSLVWRRPNAFPGDSDVIIGYLNRIAAKGQSYSDEVIQTLLEIACIPEHPLNADFLHRNLWHRTMAERDAWWSIYLSYNHDLDSATGRLVEWALHDDTSACTDDAALLCGITLGWFLTTSDRELRDTATKALVVLVCNRLPTLMELLRRFRDVNDLYVSERLYAVAYAYALMQTDGTGIADLAELIYEQTFAGGQPPVHILLRDYARGVIEQCRRLGANVPSIDADKIAPPYRSPWPLRPPSDEQLKRLDETDHESLATIRFSVLEWGDFHRYVIEPNVSQFVAPNQRSRGQAAKREQQRRAKAAWETFLKSLTKRQLVALEQRISGGAERLDHFARRLNEHQIALLQAFQREQPRRSQRDPITIDVRMVSRWIFRRVLQLGWTPARFANFDRAQQLVDRSAPRSEPIGKKYQWIALHEVLARLADHCQVHERWRDEPTHPYRGAWELSIRDIDPSFLPRQRLDTTTAGEPWWAPVAVRIEVDDPADGEAWLQQSDLPQPVALADIRGMDGRRWFALEGFYQWESPLPPEADRSQSERREIWCMLRSYLVRRDDLPAFVSWAEGRNWMGRYMPEGQDFYGVYLGEYPWHAAAAETHVDWTTGWDEANSPPVPILVTATRYLLEDRDYSVKERINGLLPSSALAKGLDLRWQGEPFRYQDSSGRLIAQGLQSSVVGHSCLVVDAEALQSLLDRKGYSVVWTILGEKMVLPARTSDMDRHGRCEFSSFMSLEDNTIEAGIIRPNYVAPSEPRRS